LRELLDLQMKKVRTQKRGAKGLARGLEGEPEIRIFDSQGRKEKSARPDGSGKKGEEGGRGKAMTVQGGRRPRVYMKEGNYLERNRKKGTLGQRCERKKNWRDRKLGERATRGGKKGNTQGN